MYQSLSLPLYEATRADYGSWEELRKDCIALGCDGVEGIWAGEEIPADFPRDLLMGYHLTFFPDWLDFYRGDKGALKEKFGSLEAAYAMYGGENGPETLLKLYREDLQRAECLGAKYVVFHVSDVSLEEGFTYRWLHSDEEVLDASAELINVLMAGRENGPEFLVENQWWAGFTFTEPEKTERLLSAIQYPRKGIMLDTGHLMNTDTRLITQSDGLALLNRCLERHGELSGYIRGVHLHQSISGRYVRTHTGALPKDLPEDYGERFAASYGHILQIDRHRPWTNPMIAQFLRRAKPTYVTHELSASGRQARMQAVMRQVNTLKKGWRLCE